MLMVAQVLTRAEVGWIRQHPELLKKVQPIEDPYTARGAIKGLLPHGPHNLRDILATHNLKQTGSYEQAIHAIQDTPDVVQQHYGRFLPQDKAALAAKILNQVWKPHSRADEWLLHIAQCRCKPSPASVRVVPVVSDLRGYEPLTDMFASAQRQ